MIILLINRGKDFVRILNEPEYSLIKQYVAIISTEGVKMEFSADAVMRIAEISYRVNEECENIGARRLHTVLERLLEDVSFDASDSDNEHFFIDKNYVDKKLGGLVRDRDMSQYIL